MSVGFKLSHRLARAFSAITTAAAIAACAMDRPTASISHAVYVITVTPQIATLTVDSTLQLGVIVYDSLGDMLSGRAVTGADSGSATITATSEGKSAFATVHVNRKKPAPPPPPAPSTGFFVSPSGSSSADGSIAHPLDLPSVLANSSGRIQAGDTVWLRGCTYRGNFRSFLSGTATKPIAVRHYPGERAIIDGGSGSATASTWYVGGQYSTFWGFELINSNPDRVL